MIKANDNPWALYDALIDPIPPDLKVDEAILGGHWAYVRCGSRVGLAMNLARVEDTETRPRLLGETLRGIPLRELAGASKFWNFGEASLGVAAINAYWNSTEHEAVARAMEGEPRNAFAAWQDRVRGKKVAVIGHFMHLEQTLGRVCELSILERQPSPGDYPDTACEYILSEQDFIFSTGVTLINKTLGRLLELSQRQGMILAGPTVSLAPPLFDFGAADLQGLVITDPDLCRDVITGKNDCASVFDAGKRINISPPMDPRINGTGALPHTRFGDSGPYGPAFRRHGGAHTLCSAGGGSEGVCRPHLSEANSRAVYAFAARTP